MTWPGAQLSKSLNLFSSPPSIFILVGLVFGLLYLFCVPPFQVADEDRHFFRAFQVAEGRFASEVHDGQAGGWMPVSVMEFAAAAETQRWDLTAKTTRAEILDHLHTPLNPEQRVFVPFRSAVYSPVAYLPAATAMRAAMLFKASPLVLLYTGRMAALGVWLALVCTAIRMVPLYKWLFFVLALTPMSLFQAASLSADSLTNALAFLALALFLAETFTEKPFRRQSFYRLLAVTVLLVLTKNVLFLFVLLFLMIPVRRFDCRRRYWGTFAALAAVNILALAVWSAVTARLPVFWAVDVFPARQAAFIFRHPIDYLLTLAKTIAQYHWYYYSGFIGAFGWKFVYLGPWHVRLWVLLIVIVSLADGSGRRRLSARHKILMAAVFGATTGLIFTLLYICWNPVGAPIIEGVQSRYFIPLAPLLCMLLSNRALSTDRFHWKPAVIPAAAVISLSAALAVIVERFYAA